MGSTNAAQQSFSMPAALSLPIRTLINPCGSCGIKGSCELLLLLETRL